MVIDNPTNNMMTVTEASKILHIHPDTLRRWSDKGAIKSYRVTSRGDRRFTTGNINQFLAEMSNQNQ
jgi:excisionase family DNA binding protein